MMKIRKNKNWTKWLLGCWMTAFILSLSMGAVFADETVVADIQEVDVKTESEEILEIETAVKEIQVTVSQDLQNHETYLVSTVGCAGKTTIRKVMFPIWTERNGQDDLHWYEGIRDSDGEYRITVNNQNHGFETGIYNIHTYIYGDSGQVLKTLVNTYMQEAERPIIKIGEIENNCYKVSISGVSNAQGVIGVSFPTWTQSGGQNDLRWENGNYVGHDTWETTINIDNYQRSYDTFITHAYITNCDRQQKFIGETEQCILNPFDQEPLKISSKQQTDNSKFVVNTENCKGKSGIKSVWFAVWSERNGQDEIRWYQGTRDNNGEFVMSDDVENHGFETGPFIIHAYLRGNNEENIAFADNLFKMEKMNATIEYDHAVLNNTFKMRIRNVGDQNGVTSIVFPTWSRTNGQDDIRWEPATYIGGHTWEATIHLKDYQMIVDDFISHAYLTDKNGHMVFLTDSVKRILQNTQTIYGYFAYPLDKNYRPNANDPTDWFGPRWGDIHEGVDIPADRYASCFAVGDGIVEKADYFMGYGRYIRIRTTDRYGESVSFFYGHLQEINVSVGQTVSKGQKIGSVGGSGYNAQGNYSDNAFGSHLHFGAIANADDACVDPEIWIDFHNPNSN
ncbi:GBS Bsp-like repeat-containing protein [Acetobacterium woodii]|nr:GBS Bsp-like repeat-containing protein [Acetobacterium woodii]